MTDTFIIEKKIKEIIDDLKGLCSTEGLSNTASEEKVITSVFLYKFLNDKFIYNLSLFAKDMGMTVEEVLKNENDDLDAFYDMHATDVALAYEDTINYLIDYISLDEFYKKFDDALVRISNSVKNELFVITTADGKKKGIFEPITAVIDSGVKRNNFAKAIFAIISQEKFDFSGAFKNNFDFYSTIFEYLIKDYNVASGTYAEYFTPQAVSKIIARILIGSTKTVQAAEIYDPAAGSGSLVLHLANELGQDQGVNRALVYTQDISQKSSRFLRINMLLNGLTESLHNIIEGDTLLDPAHYKDEGNALSGLKTFDYIVTNPPFNTDFSSKKNQIEKKWEDTNRFFAGVPNIPKEKKESMAIYTMFFQHVLYSLKDTGKAAIVVPTGFITAQSGIQRKIRERLVKDKMLKGVVSMPSNIFANTGTNVSIIFLDKSNLDDELILMDASNLGSKVKDGKNQRTVLSITEENRIIDTFIKKDKIEGFSVIVTYDELKIMNCSLAAGQYFDFVIKYDDITEFEFETKIRDVKETLRSNFINSKKLEDEIFENLEELIYEKNKA